MAQPCSSNPTSGCDNSALLAKINTCCSEQHTDSVAILAKLELIRAGNVTCCNSITTKLDTIAGLLQEIVDK